LNAALHPTHGDWARGDWASVTSGTSLVGLRVGVGSELVTLLKRVHQVEECAIAVVQSLYMVTLRASTYQTSRLPPQFEVRQAVISAGLMQVRLCFSIPRPCGRARSKTMPAA
jgi:hypothetical protein